MSCLAMIFIASALSCYVNASGDHAHDHGEVEAVQITRWNSDIELFIEYEPFVAEKATEIITHVTLLQGWQPRRSGPLVLVFSVDGETPFEVHAEAPIRDGIYLPEVTFPHGGTWQLDVRIPLEKTETQLTIYGLKVYASEHDAQHDSGHAHGSETTISFLKEQQWRMPFRSEAVVQDTFRESLPTYGQIRARAGGEIHYQAPVTGRYLAVADKLPLPGTAVKKGQKLGSIIPQLRVGDDPSTLTLAVTQAELAYAFAQEERARVKRLIDQEAVPQNRLRLAELAVDNAKADLTAAQDRLRQVRASQKASQTAGKGRIDLYAPLSGMILQTHALSGAVVEAGDPLFYLVDLSRVWLEAHIPEANVSRIRQTDGAWFQVEGMDTVFQVSPEDDSRLIALGGAVHPQRRTVPLIFELPNPEGLLRMGMFAEISVLTGKRGTGLAVPIQALVEEAGQAVVYVHTGGETFERRVVRQGIRDGNRVQITSGLSAGDRVVTRGAYQVRLAAASDSVPSHGHAH